jgi:transposase InsO family protein
MGVAVCGGDVDEVFFHSDRDPENTAGLYRQVCQRLHFTHSMGRVGPAPDNDLAESFLSTLEFECLHKYRFRHQGRRPANHRCMDRPYDRHRHSNIGMIAPFAATLAFTAS